MTMTLCHYILSQTGPAILLPAIRPQVYTLVMRLAAGLALLLAFPARPATAQVTQAWLAELPDILPLATGAFEGKEASMTVDADGNVYVATSSFDSTGTYGQALLAKYSADGMLEWTRTQDGAPFAFDTFRSVAVDGDNGVYVTGWMALEHANGAYSNQIITQKYDRTTGSHVWTRTYDAFERGDLAFCCGSDKAIAVATDAFNNVYIAGTSNQTGIAGFTSSDFILIKYDSTGDELWMRTFDEASFDPSASAPSTDLFYDMTVDDSGTAYLTGSTDRSFNANYLTVVYAANGDVQWFRTFDTEGNFSSDTDHPSDIAVDPAGNVIVTGTVSFPCEATCRDYLTIKYTAFGDSLWTARYDNGHASLRNDDWATAVAVDDDANIYVTGYSEQADEPYYDYLTIKYDASGSTVWTRRYNGPANEHDVPYAMSVDSSGVYVTGNTGTAGGLSDSEYGTIKYSPSGDSLWFITKDPTTPGSADYPTAHVLHANGDLYVTGYQDLSGPGVLITVKYTQSDDPVPVELVAFDGIVDAGIVRLAWQTLTETNNAGFEVQRRVDEAGAWTVLGFVEGAGTTAEPQTYRFADRALPVGAATLTYRLRQVDLDGTAALSPAVEVVVGRAAAFAFHPPFPNPSPDAVTLRYELPQRAPVRLTLYNLLGQRVATLVDATEPPGRKEVRVDLRRLAAGLYIAVLDTGDTHAVRRIVVVK